jgi:ribosomal protein L3 glutamine methyltransferase
MNKTSRAQLTNLIAQASNQCNTIRDILRFSVSAFNHYKIAYGHGTHNAYEEALYLITASINLLDEWLNNNLEVYLDAVLLESERTLIFERLHQRIANNIPTAYLTNCAVIQGYKFYIDNRAIVPRSFIPEILINGRLDSFINNIQVNNILDLCTGNGSIAIIANHYFPESKIVATDIDSNALKVAEINIDDYQLQHKIKLVESDLFSKLPPNNKFDIIFSNPPYVNQAIMQTLPKEYLNEPQHALAGGTDGLKFVKQIISNAKNYLNPNGILVIEMGCDVAQLEQLFPQLPFTWIETTNQDGYVFVLTHQQLIDNC